MLSCKAVLSPKNAFYPIYDKIIIPTIINCLRLISFIALFNLNINKFIAAICVRVIFYCLNLYGFYQGLIEAKIIDQIKDKKQHYVVLISLAILFEPLLPTIFLIIVQYYNKQQIISSQYIQIPNDNDINDNEDTIDHKSEDIIPIVHSNEFIDEYELFEIDTNNKLNTYIEWINDKILMHHIDIDNEVFFWMVSCQFEFVAQLISCCYYTSIDWTYGYIYLDYNLFVNNKPLSMRILPLIYVIFGTFFSIKVLFYWIADMFRNCYHIQRMLLLLPAEYLLFVLTMIFDIFCSFSMYSFYANNKFNSYWNYKYFPIYISHIMILYLLFYWICIHGPFVIWYNRTDVIDCIKNHTLRFILVTCLTILITTLCVWLIYWVLFGVNMSLFSFVVIMLSNQYKMKINHNDHESFRRMWKTFCDFILNSTTTKDELFRIMSLKSILHSSGLIKNDIIYNKFVDYTENQWLISEKEQQQIMNHKITNIQNFISKPSSNIERFKGVLYPISTDMINGIYSLKLDFGNVVYYGECGLIFVFSVLLFVIILSKICMMPYIFIQWILNMNSILDYILCCICGLLLLGIIWLIIIIYKQRKLVNYIVLLDENWNGMIYDEYKESKQINHLNSDIQERYESLTKFKEIKFILEYYFIDEIANIMWSYSCGELTYKELNDFEYLFTETSLPFVVQRSQNGLYVSHCMCDEFKDKMIIGSQIIAANNHNLQYNSFEEAHDYVTKKIRLPITMIFRPPY